MRIEDEPKFEECLKIAEKLERLDKESRKILSEKEEVNKEYLEAFRKLRKETIIKLQKEKEEIIQEKEALEAEYYELASIFCQKNRAHMYKYRKEITSYIPKKHTYMGDIYPSILYQTCLICGYGNDPDNMFKHRKCYREGYKKIIQEASQQSDNLELQKTAQRILEIEKELENNIKEKLDENQKAFDEICILFGHDIGYPGDATYFKCKCCKKHISAKEYLKTGNKAKYKEVVGFYSWVGSYIGSFS